MARAGRVVAGIDIGNSTTEAVLLEKLDGESRYLAGAMTATTGVKGTPDNAKGCLEALDEALRAAGATYGQIVVQAVIPMSITSVVSWVLYMIETNIRDATLIGLLTGTGIGFVFDVYYKSFRYDVAGLVILAIILAVVACELTSNFVRRRIL